MGSACTLEAVGPAGLYEDSATGHHRHLSSVSPFSSPQQSPSDAPNYEDKNNNKVTTHQLNASTNMPNIAHANSEVVGGHARILDLTLKDSSLELLGLLGPLAGKYAAASMVPVAENGGPLPDNSADFIVKCCAQTCDPSSGYLGNLAHVASFLDRGLIAKILLDVPGMDEQIFGAPAPTHGCVTPLHIAVAERNVRFLSALVQHFSPCIVSKESRQQVVSSYRRQFVPWAEDTTAPTTQELYAALASDLMVDALDASDEVLEKRRRMITFMMNAKSTSGHTAFQMHTEAASARSKMRKRNSNLKEKGPDEQRDDAVLLCLTFLQSAVVGRSIQLKPQPDGQVCYGPPSIHSLGTILRAKEFSPADIEYYIAKDFNFPTRRVHIPEASEPELPSASATPKESAFPLFGSSAKSNSSNNGDRVLSDSSNVEDSSNVGESTAAFPLTDSSNCQVNGRGNLFVRSVARRRSSMRFLEATMESLQNSSVKSRNEDVLLASFVARQSKTSYTAAPLAACILFDNFDAFKFLLADGMARRMLEGTDSKGNSAMHLAAYRQTEMQDGRYLDFLQHHVPESRNVIYRTNDASLRPGQVRKHIVDGRQGAYQFVSPPTTAGFGPNASGDQLSESTNSTTAALRPLTAHFHVRHMEYEDASQHNASGILSGEHSQHDEEVTFEGNNYPTECGIVDPIVVTSTELTAAQRDFLGLEEAPSDEDLLAAMTGNDDVRFQYPRVM